MKLLTLACAAALAAAASLHAQSFRGGVQGTVTDESGAGLPGAQVTAVNRGTSLTRSATSDASGGYLIAELPPGDYQVTASLQGFRTQVVKGVRVDVSAHTRVDLALAVGTVQEAVEVVAGVTLVETTGNVQGGTIQGEQASELPLNGRDFVKLMTLVPGSASDPSNVSDSPGSFGLFTVNGSRGRSNNYLLDGTDMNDGYRNLPAINEAGVFGTPATILPIDAVEEFPVMSNTEAEYGRNSGAVVNIVTKSGTNTLRGSVFEYFRDDSLNARNVFNTKPNPKVGFRNHQFGGSLGGPLRRDRTFFFAAYEGQREEVGLPSLARVPTREELQAAVAANDGAVNPVIAGLLARSPWPEPNRAPDSAGNNLETTTPGTNRVDSLILKVDHQMGGSDLLTARYFFGDSDQSFPLALLGGGILPGYNTETPTTVHLLSASYTRTLSPQVLLEVRGGYNRFDEDFFPEDREFDPASIGLNNNTRPQDFGLPLIRVEGYAPLGSNLSLPRGRVDTNYHGVASLAYSTGRHHWKGGYEWRRTTVDGFFDAGYRGRLDFASLDDFVAGRLDGGRQARGDSRRFTFQNSHGFYLQDRFQVARRLTVNLGLRWDYYGVIGEEQARFSVLDAGIGRVVGVDQLYEKDWDNFAPRVSAAWDLAGDGRTVLRAGWGIYFDAFSQDFFVGQLPWNTFNPGPAYNDVAFSFAPVPVLERGLQVFPEDSFAASDVFTVDRRMRTPYMHNFNANVQRQLGRHAALQVGYVGSLGRQLFRYRDINQVSPEGEVPFPAYLYVNQFEATARSSYHGLQTSLRLLNLKGLTSTLNYTWSHSIDTASDGQDYVPNASQPDDSRNPDREKASSNFDVRQRLAWYFSYEPGGRPQRPRGLFSGWALDGILTASTGMPFNINYLFQDDFNGSGQFFGRPDLVGNPFLDTTSGPDRFLNLSAFQAPCDPNGSGGCDGGQHFGNLGRNAFDGPGFFNVDLSLVKNTALGDRVTLQLRVDVFNVLNHPNFANPLLPNFAVDFLQNGIDEATNRGVGFLPLTATPDVATGNPFLGGGGPRQIQLAARVSF